MRLHIGGTETKPGWKILNALAGPGVDYVGDCVDLSQFPNESVDEVYASHVLEHLGYLDRLPAAVGEIYRVLKKGGHAKISVPDLDVLCRLFLDPSMDVANRYTIMRMIFGGQTDPYDFHFVGLSHDLLAEILSGTGFSRIEKVGEFGLFQDGSTMEFGGVPISLNVIAYK